MIKDAENHRRKGETTKVMFLFRLYSERSQLSATLRRGVATLFLLLYFTFPEYFVRSLVLIRYIHKICVS